MIRSYNNLKDKRLRAVDKEIGVLRDFYFDDISWKLPYFTIELDLSKKNILVPIAILSCFDGISLNLELTAGELQCGLDQSSISQMSVRKTYQDRILCDRNDLDRIIEPMPILVMPESDGLVFISSNNPHLRNCSKLLSYDFCGIDGNLGKIQDLLIDDSTWQIRSLIAKVNGICAHQEKVFSPKVVDEVNLAHEMVKANVSKKQALMRPTFDSDRHLDTSYEMFKKNYMNSLHEETTYKKIGSAIRLL